MNKLSISNLHVSVEGKEIVRGISLTVKSGKVHAIMGPNGSGKSTLAYALMGHSSYEVKSAKLKVKSLISIDRKNITELKPDERGRMGLFLAFQNPLTVAGVPLVSMLRTAYAAIKGRSLSVRVPGRHGWIKTPTSDGNGHRQMSVVEFNRLVEEKARLLELDASFLSRGLNDGFSGGEKKKAEMLQALVLQPKFAIFDEVDTGLDVDALKTVANGIRQLADDGTGVIIITHYQRILHHVRPDYVHVLMDGRIVKSGGYELAEEIEKSGYSSITRQKHFKLKV